MDGLYASIAAQNLALKGLRARLPGGLRAFEHSQDLDLTYTSNAIEGNSLTAAETAIVIEQGSAIGGKPLRDHNEAIDLYAAHRYVRVLSPRTESLTEMDIRSLHRLVLLRSDPDIGGRYADQGRYVLTDTGRHAFPSPAEIPILMHEFSAWLRAEPMTAAAAFTAHRRLVEIHPFNDGNGRTARLLMNLMLIRSGFPPIAIRPPDRAAYVAALQTAQSGEGPERFDHLLHERLAATLTEYLSAAQEAIAAIPPDDGPC